MSSFFHSRQSSELLPEINLKPKAATKKRRVLHERTPSDINRDNGDQQPTIRLVDSSSSLKNVYNKNPFPHMPSQVLQPPQASRHGYTVQNDEASSSLDTRLQDNLQPPGRSERLLPSTLNLRHSNRHSNRLSTFSQSTTTSAADTLLNDSLFSPNSCRFSMDTTVRNTPTPMMSEEKEMERQMERLKEESHENLPAVAETSFESSTIRPVTASTTSEHSGSRGSGSRGSDTTQRLPSISAMMGRSGSAGPTAPVLDVSSPSQYSSSPPDHTRSSSWNIIRYASSSESMASVQYPQFRPPTAKSQSASSAWSASEEGSLPPLSVGRKRSHMHSASAGAARLSNLSTIASESEPSTRSNTRSQFSQGSLDIFTSPPVLSSSSQSGNWYVRRRTIGSSSYSSLASGSHYPSLSAESSRWDLSRENSAVPEPLFSSSPRVPMSSSPMITHPSSSGVHELPGDVPSEIDDTIAELQSHPLRAQRSGPLTRGRSFSEPRPASARSNHTMGTMYYPDRTSQGSSIFPQWAKEFYRGQAYFPNPNESNASLAYSDGQIPHASTSQSLRMMPWAYHRRWESAGDSLRSSPNHQGTPFSASPRSSHFLPSMFRAYRNRQASNSRSQSTGTGTRSGTRSSSLAEMYVDESQLNFSDSGSSTDSMAITPVVPGARNVSGGRPEPPRRQQTVNSARAIPRDPTNTSSQYPQSLSASHIYATPPHLAPSRRLSHRLSTWRAPSFDEALNTLILSRGNRQILLFCCGFLCPILWMVAAVLPLPLRPMETTMNNLEASVQDLSELEGEKGRFALGVQMEMMDWQQERRYLKARWWRNLNRIMSIVGVGIIAAIIALAVVASK